MTRSVAAIIIQIEPAEIDFAPAGIAASSIGFVFSIQTVAIEHAGVVR